MMAREKDLLLLHASMPSIYVSLVSFTSHTLLFLKRKNASSSDYHRHMASQFFIPLINKL